MLYLLPTVDEQNMTSKICTSWEIKLLQGIRDACQCRWKPCNYICTHIGSYTYKWRIDKQIDKYVYTYIILPQQQDFGSIYLSTTSQAIALASPRMKGSLGRMTFSRKNATDFNWRSKINFQVVVAGCWAYWNFEHASEVIPKFPEGQWCSKFFPRFFLLCSS